MDPTAFNSTYESVHEFTGLLNGEEIRYHSKKGLPDWDRITPAVALAAENIRLSSPDQRLFLIGCGHGALGVSIGRRIPRGEICLTDNNVIALEMSRRTLMANSIENAHLLAESSLPTDLKASFDTAIIMLPKGRKLARRWLLEAQTALRYGGELYLCGANEEGIQPVIRDAESIFGKAAIPGYKKGNRVARLVKTEDKPVLPAWTIEPGIRPGSWFELQVEVFGEVLKLSSLPGVFSYDRFDEGSQLLLTKMEIHPDEKVLDLGSGYGILGLAAAKAGAGQVDLVDVNLLAVAAAQQNIAQLQIKNARALPSDVASAVKDQRYSLIVTNPPFHTGKAVDYDVAYAFIAQAQQGLLPGGRFLLVANRFIRYEPILRQLFPKVDRVAETGKYQVFLARR